MTAIKHIQFSGVPYVRNAREVARHAKFPFDHTDVTGRRFTGTISDTVALLYPPGNPETPISRRVTLFDRTTMRPITSVWSDPATGAYSFTNLSKTTPFLVMADDHTGTYNAVVGDWLYAD